MKWNGLFIFLLGLVVFTSQAASSKEILIVGSGGWKSCKNGIRTQFIGRQLDNLVKDLKASLPHDRFSVIKTCTDFKAAGWGIGFPYLYEGARGNWQGSTTPEGMAGLIQRYRVGASDLIFLIGHSHGGWHAMAAASRLDRVEGVFSLEPVSAAQCDVRDYLRTREKRVLKFRQRIVAGCQRAPTDIDRGRIASVVRSGWHNYILSAGEHKGDIHSSAMGEASNFEYAILQGDRSHHFLGLSPYIWRDICHKISAAAGAGAGNPKCSAMQVDGEGNFLRFLQ